MFTIIELAKNASQEMLQAPISRIEQGLVMMVKKIITAFSARNNESFYWIRQKLDGCLVIPLQIRYDGAVIGGPYTVVYQEL